MSHDCSFRSSSSSSGGGSDGTLHSSSSSSGGRLEVPRESPACTPSETAATHSSNRPTCSSLDARRQLPSELSSKLPSDNTSTVAAEQAHLQLLERAAEAAQAVSVASHQQQQAGQAAVAARQQGLHAAPLVGFRPELDALLAQRLFQLLQPLLALCAREVDLSKLPDRWI